MNKEQLKIIFLAIIAIILNVSGTIRASSHDVAWTLGNVGSFSYRLDAFSPADGRLFYADLDPGLIRELVIGVDDRALDLYVKGFGQDLDGEIYLLASSNLGPYGTGGVVLKIVDLCLYRIPADINNDCQVNIDDFDIMVEHWMENALRSP